MVPFAGYEMPVQYRDGVLTEHRWTRDQAGLFACPIWDRRACVVLRRLRPSKR